MPERTPWECRIRLDRARHASCVVGCVLRFQGWCALFAFAAVACAAPRVVPLIGSTRASNTAAEALDVVARSTAVGDPLPVSGANVAYGDLGLALGRAIRVAAEPWAERASTRVPGGFQLFVEATEAEAEYSHQRLTVTLVVRVTLRGRRGNVYFAQTQTHCRSAALTSPEQGTSVVGVCLAQAGDSVVGWLEGVDLGSSGEER
jgi:hypothetical protein